MGYHIKSASVSFEGNKRLIGVELEKRIPLIDDFLCILFEKPDTKPMRHKVFFDLYDHKTTHKIYDGYATIDRDWIDLGYGPRNEIALLLQKHFMSDYQVGNFRNTLKKV